MIDNSISMGDKQDILRLANANLVAQLSNPSCVAADGSVIGPPAPGADCAPGQRRAFQALTDIHIAIISSSLGDAGANSACAPDGPQSVPDRIDMAHLIGSLPRGASSGANAAGFLEWRAGEDVNELNQSFQSLLSAVGESGCGWEMSLESWYRFLIDPRPYRGLERVSCSNPDFSVNPDAGADAGPSTSPAQNCVRPMTNADGSIALDTELLAQRAAFLRPDSLLAIVMLSDENDCSIQVGGQSWIVADLDDTRPMYRGSSTCDTNPNHPCCYTCAAGVPADCPLALDPVCTADPNSARLPPVADGTNLRCFDQRRRFGTDFLYPTRRYVNALKERQLCLSDASLRATQCPDADRIDNPLYASGQRSPDDVLLAGIIGVPWQRLAASVDARGNPLPPEALRFKSASELAAADWAALLGSPHDTPPRPPTDPFMRESSTPRPGIEVGNPINGREYDTTDPNRPGTPDDLEYACIFRLPVPRQCSGSDALERRCDCADGDFNRPVCEEVPGNGSPGTIQYWSKAYPGLRHLDVLREYGDNAVVASICARNVTDASQPDFAYRPALDALVERLEARLGGL